MQHHSPVAKFLSAVLALALPAVLSPALAAPAGASLTGRVLAAGTDAPLDGWTVLVGNPKTRTVQTSATTAADGTFSIAALPPADYEVAVRAGDVIYPAAGTLRLAPGQARDLQIAVYRQAAPPPGGDDQDPGATSWWSNPFVATLVVLGAAVGIGLLIDAADDDDGPATSPTSR